MEAIQDKRFHQTVSRDSLNFKFFPVKKQSLNQQTSIKKISSKKIYNHKGTFKQITSSNFQQKSSRSNLDKIKQKNTSSMNTEESDDQKNTVQPIMTSYLKHRPKGVKFKDRISIENLEGPQIRKQNILTEILNEQKISMLDSIAKINNFNLPMTSRRRGPQNVKIVSELINLPVQSKGSVIEELKCFMCHYPQQNSVLLGKNVILSVKKRLLQMSKMDCEEETFFRYEAFGYFLKVLNDLNYDSSEVITAYETVLTKYTYPTNVKLMLYYLGNILYQLNNLYDRSEEILRKMCEELLKLKLYQYIGIYLILIVKMKANLLEWDLCSSYLMKLLAYAWLYKFQNLQIWVYFQLSRTFFFMNQPHESQYFKTRFEMSIIEPTTNIYRELIAKNFTQELIFMRTEHQNFDLSRKILTCELMKIETQSTFQFKEKQDFKLQAQIKSINQHCKIRYVKNLLYRMNSSQQAQTCRNSAKYTFFNSKSTAKFAGNPLLRTHESGIKNLNIYFRKNPKGQSLINKNRQPKLYTFQNSNKNILVLKQLCRNILLEMKWYVSINLNQN